MHYNYEDIVNRYDSLTAQEECYLWNRVEEGDEKARIIIINSCLKYVLRCSKRTQKYTGININDLIGEGNLALMEACQKYDRTKGARFYTYARYEVEGAIKKMIANASKQRESQNVDIKNFQDKDANTLFSDENVSWCKCLSERIQNYLDQNYYPGVGRLFLDTMLLTTEGLSLSEAAAKQNVMPEFIRGMKRKVILHFKNCKRLAA